MTTDTLAIIQSIQDVGFAQIGILLALIFAVTWRG